MIHDQDFGWFATLPIMSKSQASILFKYYSQFWEEVEIVQCASGTWIIKFRFAKGE